MTRSRSGASPSEGYKGIEPTITKEVPTNKIAELTYYTKMKDPSRNNEACKTGKINVTKDELISLICEN